MKKIGFIKGRPKPLPRTTEIDKTNAEKSKLGLLNKLGNPYKPTRYAYRLKRLLEINEYRDNIYYSIKEQYGAEPPMENLFIFFLFQPPKSWSKKKRKAHFFTPFYKRPDTSNLVKLLEDALYKEDSGVTACSYYKMYVPDYIDEGILILQEREIHEFIINSTIETFLKPRENTI
jgi:Holliday junction resolvase RusA-like endonuclease